MRPTSFLSVSVLVGQFLATGAVNPIFGAFVTPACEACLDATFASCPGDYETRDYAECMCVGNGAHNAISCSAQQCDEGINEDTNVIIALATYCVDILKETCPTYGKYLSQSVYERECSASTPAGSTSANSTETATSSFSSNVPAGTNAKSTAATPSQTKSASFATTAALPVWGIVAGLFFQAIYPVL